MKSKIDVSVVICTYNRYHLLTKCVDSILSQKCPGIIFEIVIIDNNSQDQTPEYCSKIAENRSSPPIRYFREEKQGIAFARSKGAEESRGEIVGFIDDDCLADEKWIYRICEFYQRHPEATSTGGRIIPKYLTEMAPWYGKYFWGLVGHYDLGKKVFEMTGVRYPAGANMHFRKKAFLKYGYFDGALGRKGKLLLAGEEKAMYLKLRANNEKVYYLPDVIVYHHVDSNKFDLNYVRKHSFGIGASERVMNSTSNTRLLLKFLEYVGKLGYAIIYGILYLIQGNLSKMTALIKFRWWVLVGFLYPSKLSE